MGIVDWGSGLVSSDLPGMIEDMRIGDHPAVPSFVGRLEPGPVVPSSPGEAVIGFGITEPIGKTLAAIAVPHAEKVTVAQHRGASNGGLAVMSEVDAGAGRARPMQPVAAAGVADEI